MQSLREAFVQLGLAPPWSIRKLNSPRPSSLRALITASRSPRLSEATRHRTWYGENYNFGENAQGMDVDMQARVMYIAANANDRHEGVYRVPFDKSAPSFLRSPFDDGDLHPGALCVHDGWVYIPIQPDDGE